MDLVTNTYNLLWELIIRPCRHVYQTSDLGPANFVIRGMECERIDLQLTNDRGQKLNCSHYWPCARVGAVRQRRSNSTMFSWLWGLRESGEKEEIEKIGCVIYLHGNSSSRLEALEVLPVLLPRNISVFCLDLSGSGMSDGEYISLGYFEQQDVRVAIDHLRHSGQVNAIGLWGRSMGAATSILRAGEDPEIAACVLDSAFSSLPMVAEEVVNFALIPVPRLLFALALEIVRKEVRARAEFDICELLPIKSAPRAVSPALFAMAGDDSFILPHHTQDLHDVWGGATRMLLTFEGGHNGHRPDWFFSKAASFLEKHLAAYANGDRSVSEIDQAASQCHADTNDSCSDCSEDSSCAGAEDGDLDDLEYLTLDLANVLPTESWQRLLETLRSQEGAAMTDLRDEVRLLRRAVRKKRMLIQAKDRCPECSVIEESPHMNPTLINALRSDLEARVSAMAAERRGESGIDALAKCIDALGEDLRDAAKEALVFLCDTEAIYCNLPRLLAMLTQLLSWSTNPDVDAAALLSQVPELSLQRGQICAAACSESHVRGPEPRELSEFPHCVPHALQAVAALSDDGHVQRVGLACIAIGTYGVVGRKALLEETGNGLRTILRAAARRPHHPEVQTWALLIIANCAKELSRDTEGESLASEAAACCAASLHAFPHAPDLLENGARALAALIAVHPQCVVTIALANGLPSVLQEARERFPNVDSRWNELHHCLAQVISVLERGQVMEQYQRQPMGSGCDSENWRSWCVAGAMTAFDQQLQGVWTSIESRVDACNVPAASDLKPNLSMPALELPALEDPVKKALSGLDLRLPNFWPSRNARVAFHKMPAASQRPKISAPERIPVPLLKQEVG